MEVLSVGTSKLIQMAKFSIASILVIVFCVSAAAATRTKLYSINGRGGSMPASSPNASDGICKSLVETQGYVCQEHNVTTQDGYILSLQRIPMGRSGQAADKPPVLLQHGILSDGATWLINLPDESLPFILADNGYDVWIANTRGTKYSSGHTSLSSNDPAYWDWSWDELAAYDLPASFQYVHDQTGDKLHYVGHSLGTLIALAAFSQEKLASMTRSAALLCPIAYLDQMPSQPAKIAADMFLAEDLYWLGVKEFLPGEEAAAKLLETICSKPGVNCSDLMTAFTGQTCCVNASRINILLEHEPQPTSTKNLIHLAQMIRKGNIAMYDYGNKDDNMKKYGQPTPPEYNMPSIPNELPLFLSHGGNDMLSDINDVQHLLGSLKEHSGNDMVVQLVENYAHVDFVLGVTANKIVYNPIMSFFSLH